MVSAPPPACAVMAMSVRPAAERNYLVRLWRLDVRRNKSLVLTFRSSSWEVAVAMLRAYAPQPNESVEIECYSGPIGDDLD